MFLWKIFSEIITISLGISVKLYNGIKGTWEGYSVHSSMKPKILSRQIYAIAKTERNMVL